MSKSISQRKLPTVKDLLAEQLRDVTSPMPVDVLIGNVLELHPSKAKDPRASIRTIITEQVGRLLVYTNRDHVLPMRIAMQGVRFRIPLSQLEMDEGGFVMSYLRHYVDVGYGVPLENRIQLREMRTACPSQHARSST